MPPPSPALTPRMRQRHQRLAIGRLPEEARQVAERHRPNDRASSASLTRAFPFAQCRPVGAAWRTETFNNRATPSWRLRAPPSTVT
jgi:hypothetical protein